MYYFDEKVPTELCKIMGKNKSDKGHEHITYAKHNYSTFYFSIFNLLRNNVLSIFELGLGTDNITIPSNMGANGRPGASLYGWSEFFPNSNIYGADIDKNILFNNERINTFFCDQTQPEIIKNMWNFPELNFEFDIIIEDGLHTFEANVCFFENSIHKLKRGGYYIIEDIKNIEMNLFEKKIEEWKKIYNHLDFTILKIPSTVNFKDNNLLVVKYI
jgi:hypothetical protein